MGIKLFFTWLPLLAFPLPCMCALCSPPLLFLLCALKNREAVNSLHKRRPPYEKDYRLKKLRIKPLKETNLGVTRALWQCFWFCLWMHPEKYFINWLKVVVVVFCPEHLINGTKNLDLPVTNIPIPIHMDVSLVCSFKLIYNRVVCISACIILCGFCRVPWNGCD